MSFESFGVFLSKCILTLSHGNSAPESGFSLNKSILDVYGRSLDDETLVSLRTIKNVCIGSGGYLNIDITSALIKSTKQSYQKYNAAIEEKRKLKGAIDKKEQEEINLKRKREHEDSLQEEISRKRLAIEVAEEQIQDANTDLQEILKSNTLSRARLQKVKARLSLAIQQKLMITKELHDLEKRKK